MGSNLKRRHIIQDAVCKRCYQEEETEVHLLFECLYAKMVWRASGLANTILTNSTTTLEEKIEECIRCCSVSSLAQLQDHPIWILWRLWKSRNMLIFRRKVIPWRILLQQSITDAKEWHENSRDIDTSYQSTNHPTRCNREVHWKKPPENWMKINVDGGFQSNTERSRAGWVYRDHLGVLSWRSTSSRQNS